MQKLGLFLFAGRYRRVVHQKRVFSIHWLTAANYRLAASSYITAVPKSIDIVIVDSAIGALLKVHVAIHKQYVLSVLLMDQRVSSLLLFYVTIGFEKAEISAFGKR